MQALVDRWTAFLACLTVACCVFHPTSAAAAKVPPPAELQAALGVAPETVEVIEPHLTRGNETTRVRYIGWPIERVLDQLIGREWAQKNPEIEFRALDGYVSRVPVERFRQYRAYLVHARADGAPFVVDVIAQNEKNVPLGPHYLVWDNTKDAALQSEGATWWPYQVTTISSAADTLAALLPGDLAGRFTEEATLTGKYCLTCHKLNGYGGEKFPIDLAERVREMQPHEFERWVLDPNAVRRGTTMPALQPNQSASERLELAQRLYRYIRAMPVAAPR